MIPEIKAKWLEALRSGEYKQGRVRLRTGESKFCCLGVLTDLYIKETPAPKWGEGELNPSCCYLPNEVMKWADLRSVNPSDAEGMFLSDHNDEGLDFQTIADIIEKEI